MRAPLVLLLAAACIAPSALLAANAPAAAEAADVPPLLELMGCENLSGSFAVPADEARALLPPGFAPRSADVSGQAIMWVVGLRCAQSAHAGTPLGEAYVAYAELDVVPPSALQVPDASDHTVPLFVLAKPQGVADAFSALGLPHVGLASVSKERLPTGGTRYTATGSEGSLTILLQPTTGGNTLGAGAWGMFGVEDGAVVSTIRGQATSAPSSSGVLAQASEGSLPLIGHARPVTRGGSVTGFDLAFDLVG